MDVMNSVVLNGATFVVHNDTDYYLGDTLYSDYGFELYWRQGRGKRELAWHKFLQAHKFYDIGKPLRIPYWSGETHVRELPLTPLITRSFVVHFVLGGEWYGLGFDGEFIVQNNHNNLFLPSAML